MLNARRTSGTPHLEMPTINRKPNSGLVPIVLGTAAFVSAAWWRKDKRKLQRNNPLAGLLNFLAGLGKGSRARSEEGTNANWKKARPAGMAAAAAAARAQGAASMAAPQQQQRAGGGAGNRKKKKNKKKR